MLHYPQEFPGDAARLIVQNWRSGTIPSNRATVAEAAWNIVGYGLKASVGGAPDQPNTGGVIAMTPNPAQLLDLGSEVQDDEEMIAKLETYDNHPPDVKLMAGLPLDNATMIKWAMGLAIRIISGLI